LFPLFFCWSVFGPFCSVRVSVEVMVGPI
jgi:hypothetical protein